MHTFKVTFLLALTSVAVLAQEHHYEDHHHAHPKYEFKYGVKDEHSHDIKEQAEKRDGHKVEGHYMLVEPDGTIRTVHYNADKHTGFHAHVHRTGHATHPVHHEKVEHHEVKISVPEFSHQQGHITASSYSNSHLH